MKLQLALDYISYKTAKELLNDLVESVDIVEIGTPMLIRDGINVVREIKNEFPCYEVLADLKIVDTGEQAANMAFSYGADIITVLGTSEDITIINSVDQAKKFNKKIMVDMIGVKKLKERSSTVDALGVDYICLHKSRDLYSVNMNPRNDLEIAKSTLKTAKIAVAGGINLSNITGIIALKPDIIIIGNGITGQKNRKETAYQIKELMNNNS